jgi:hypothetical protein
VEWNISNLRDKAERRVEFLWLLNTFAVVLTVFASFLHNEQGVVPEAWVRELQGLGAQTERVRDACEAEVGPDFHPTESLREACARLLDPNPRLAISIACTRQLVAPDIGLGTTASAKVGR